MFVYTLLEIAIRIVSNSGQIGSPVSLSFEPKAQAPSSTALTPASSNSAQTNLCDGNSWIKFYLNQNEKYIQLGIRKQCMKAIDIHDALVDEGFKISYPTTNNYVNKLTNKAKEAFVKQIYEYGDVCNCKCFRRHI